MTLCTLRLRMIYTSVGVTSASVFEQGFEFPTFKLSKTKRTVSLFNNVAYCPESSAHRNVNHSLIGQISVANLKIYTIRTKKKADNFNIAQTIVIFCSSINLQCLQWKYSYDKGGYDNRLQLKQKGNGIEFFYGQMNTFRNKNLHYL